MKLHRFQNIPEIQQQSLTPTTKKSVPAVLSTVAEMLNLLYKVMHSDFAAQISNEQISLEIGSTENCILKNIRLTVGPNQPSVQWVGGVSSQGVKWPRCEVDDQLLSSAEDKNDYSYTSTHPCAF